MRTSSVRMPLVLLALLLCVGAAPALMSCTQGTTPGPGTPELRFWQIVWDGLDRTFATYTPTSLTTPAPIVFVLHGGFGSATVIWNGEDGRSWKALADQHGFFLVLPEGRPDPSNPGSHHWNDCRSDQNNAEAISSADDVSFISHLVDLAAARVAIDRSRVYVAGASNGGMMTYRLAMQLGDRLAAAGAMIANLPDPSECPFSAEPIPILIMNGTADPIMPYAGGCVAGPTCDRGRVRSTDATVAFWVSTNGAATTPEQVALPDVVLSDLSTVTRFTYRGGASGKDVLFYRVNNGGHQIPGPDPVSLAQVRIGGPKNRDIDAPATIWEFFEAHPRTGM